VRGAVAARAPPAGRRHEDVEEPRQLLHRAGDPRPRLQRARAALRADPRAVPAAAELHAGGARRGARSGPPPRARPGAAGGARGGRQRLLRLRDGLEPAGADDLQAAVARAGAAFTAAMQEDLNVSEALAAVFELVAACNRAHPSAAGAKAALAVFARCEDVLGCFGPEPAADATGEAPAELQQLLQQRQAAEKAKGLPGAHPPPPAP